MSGFKLTDYDIEIYNRYIRDFIPDDVIDVHTHIWKGSLDPASLDKWPSKVASQCTHEELACIYKELFPGKAFKPVYMGHPEAELSRTNAYAKSSGETNKLPYLYCTSYDTSEKKIEKAIAQDGFVGIKPYPNHAAKYIPSSEIRIFDYLPHEHLNILNEMEAVVILHIPRKNRLRDEVNIAQLMEIDSRYPKAKIIVAHVGRAYTDFDIGNAFETLKHSKNLFFDISANTLDAAMFECLKAVGAKRILFGSDMPITKMRMYRITENKTYVNVVPRGAYGDVSGDKNMKESDEAAITFFIYEEILALRRAAMKAGLSQREVSDIFYGNAQRILNLT